MAAPLFVSSGDLVADRRYQWALDYLQHGDAAAAADILTQVVETAPGFATAWFVLASVREAMSVGFAGLFFAPIWHISAPCVPKNC